MIVSSIMVTARAVIVFRCGAGTTSPSATTDCKPRSAVLGWLAEAWPSRAADRASGALLSFVRGMRGRTRTFVRRALEALAVVGFLIRAAIPVGYMPAPIADGGPLMLCPGGPGGAALLQLLQRHRAASGMASAEPDRGSPYAPPPRHAHEQHAGGNHDTDLGGDAPATEAYAWEHCALGVTLAASALFSAIDLSLPIPAAERPAALEASPPARVSFGHYRPRAPPFA